MNDKIYNGIIIKVIGGTYFVDVSFDIVECSARGVFRKRDISPCCGDNVTVTVSDNGDCVISEILPRRNEIIRPPMANLDNLIFVSSTCEPHPNLLLLDKFIAIAEYKKICPVIVFTKTDKCSPEKYAEAYAKCGIKVICVDNVSGEGCDKVMEVLKGKISAFTGNTGVGKSTLLNNLFPKLMLETNEISKKLGRGKHTTRHIEFYKLEDGGYIADTPGFSSFDTNRYDIIFKDELADCFVEFRKYFGKCQFINCSHTKEKGCAVLEAVKRGEITKSRHDNYVEMYEEARLLKEWEHKDKANK